MVSLLKYQLLKTERRWLVESSKLPVLLLRPYRRIEDRYLPGTQLRLRKVLSANGNVWFRLCKKYGKGSGLCEAITNLYISAEEHATLSGLTAAQVSKRRYRIAGGLLDLYEHPNKGLAIFSMEYESIEEAGRYVAPGFVGREVTDDPDYSGAALAKQVVRIGERT